jgi:hypothetical protein
VGSFDGVAGANRVGRAGRGRADRDAQRRNRRNQPPPGRRLPQSCRRIANHPPHLRFPRSLTEVSRENPARGIKRLTVTRVVMRAL